MTVKGGSLKLNSNGIVEGTSQVSGLRVKVTNINHDKYIWSQKKRENRGKNCFLFHRIPSLFTL